MRNRIIAKAVLVVFTFLMAIPLLAQNKEKKIDKKTKTNQIRINQDLIIKPIISPKVPNEENRKKITMYDPTFIPEEDKRVLLEIDLNYFGVSEATRNQIDNGDCLRVFGKITFEIEDLSENYNGGRSRLFTLYDQYNYRNPSTTAISYYQGNRTVAENEVMKMIDIEVPESSLQNGKLLIRVYSHLGTRHKDNDFASYDKLVMEEPDVRSFIIDGSGPQKITFKLHTDLINSERGVDFGDFIIPLGWERNVDDTHNIWVHLTVKRK